MYKNCIFKIILAILVIAIIYNILNTNKNSQPQPLRVYKQSCPCVNREGFEPEINYNNKISFTDYLNNVYKQQFRKE